jgi:hypothetical protein
MRNVFFNFGNEPTYVFFQWVREGELGAVNALIVEAYKKVETNDYYSVGGDICDCAREELARILRDKLEDTLDFVSLEDGPHPVEDEDRARSLANQLLHCAALQIHCSRVAEALLRDAGKWNPGPNPPK